MNLTQAYIHETIPTVMRVNKSKSLTFLMPLCLSHHPTLTYCLLCLSACCHCRLNFIFYNFKNLYGDIIVLQCSVSLYCTAKWISYAYTYMPSFLDFLPIWVTTEHWVEFPDFYSRLSLVIYFTYSINSYICQSQTPNSSQHPFSPLVSIHLFSISVISISVLQIKWSIPFFLIPHICVNIFFSLFDLLHCMTSLGRSIHVSANDPVSFSFRTA